MAKTVPGYDPYWKKQAPGSMNPPVPSREPAEFTARKKVAPKFKGGVHPVGGYVCPDADHTYDEGGNFHPYQGR